MPPSLVGRKGGRTHYVALVDEAQNGSKQLPTVCISKLALHIQLLHARIF